MMVAAFDCGRSVFNGVPVALGQGLPFVHPQFAVAAMAAAGIPILIHLLNRRRYVTVPWAAMRFLQAAGERRAHRMRLEHWLLLAVRMAVIAVLCLAVARPFLPLGALAILGRSRTHRVLVIDNSGSMSARAGPRDASGGRFGAAMAAVGELIDSFPRGDAVSVVTLSQPAEAVLGYAAYDRRRVRDALSDLKVTLRGTDLAGGLSAASRILAESEFPGNGRVVYVVSDLAASCRWKSLVSAARKAGRQVRSGGLVFVHVGDVATPSNVAVTDVRQAGAKQVWLDPRDATRGLLRMEADVANYSERAMDGLHVRVSVGDRAVGRRLAVETLGPNEVQTVPFSVMPGRAGSVVVRVAIEAPAGDALAIDDRRWRSVEVSRGLSVLLVEGRSGATALLGDAGYLSTALAAESQPGTQAAIQVHTIPSSAMGAEPLASYDVIALCDVGRLASDDWEGPASFVRAGGGLMVFGGDRVDADSTMPRAGTTEGALLPVRIVGVAGELESDANSVGFAPEAFTHPVLADFAGHAESGLFLARVWRRLLVEPAGARAEVLLRYTDGHPALVSGGFGAGRVMVFTTSADMRWTNLPAKGDYVSLMANAILWLAPSRGGHRTMMVGDSIREELGPEESSLSLRVRSPDGRSLAGRMVLESGTFSLSHGPVEQAGVYTATIGSREVLFAVNPDPRESDLRAMDESALRDLLHCDFGYVELQDLARHSAGQASTREVGTLLLYAVLALAAVESWVAMRFGAHR